MQALWAGEHRRAVILGGIGVATIVALLVIRVFSGGDGSDPYAGIGGALAPIPTPSAGVTTPAAAAPTPRPPVDPAVLRDPFCPLVSAAASPESPPVVCQARPAPAGRRVVALVDVFVEGGVPLARMRVGPVSFPNLHESEAFAETLRVISLSERCGEFDASGTPFSLCEGEETFK
jgi:hypothetical protein